MNAVWSLLKEHLKLDKPLLVLLVGFAVLLVPLIPRATDNALQLNNFTTDGPGLTLCLDSMTVAPYGNTANYDTGNPKFHPDVPAYWYSLRPAGYLVYGTAYLELGFLVFAPLKWLFRVPMFPWGPIILGSLSFLFSLLSLILIYNFAKKQGGIAAGLVAAAFLVLDKHFVAYTTIIHPDTLQLLLTVLVLLIALKHLQLGTLATLCVLGLLAGLHQGTKCGGVWLLPTLALALVWGWRHKGGPVTLQSCLGLSGRAALLGLTMIVGFFVTTPYAFFDGYYLASVERGRAAMTSPNPWFAAVGFWDWIWAFFTHLGPVFGPLFAVSWVWVVWQSFRAKTYRPLLLALVLAFSNILWLAAMSRLWIAVGYLLPAIGILAAVFGIFVAHVYRAARQALPKRRLAYLGLAVLVGCLMFQGQYAAAKVLSMYLWRSTTKVQTNVVAHQLIPPGSKVLMDHHAYLDPADYPNQLVDTGPLTYAQLQTHKPDYMIASAVYFEWDMPPIRAERLYQDLIFRRPEPFKIGPTGVPGIELVAVLPGVWGDWQPSVGHLEGSSFRTLLRAALGRQHPGLGPTILIYKIDNARIVPPVG